MTPAPRLGTSRPAWRTAAACSLLVLMLLAPVRRSVESGMATHMLIQYPGLMLVGALLAAALPRRWQSAVQRWNELGIAGLAGGALVLAVSMIPRVLDLALVDPRVEALKLIALVGAGAAIALSWQRAGLVVQAFFLGNVLPMMAVVGTLYQDSAVRVCNAYRLDDQHDAGVALVWLAIAIAALWLVRVARRATAGATRVEPVE